ncbi:hypothetical protein BN6_67150 [Saccharothrix espanaensis DSM 44229]|uniref:Uncharacterized protein n=1 Tax=Saccharothrix espanaensis (strain ATCC 51144 / DSM 44229 / JCM 9112 / NBRC 15066 / NRRL 15764) TaxID=1179773 RepID=K0K8T1_SACES|nr:hypothetical protein BN6_67150 [Saccharothrix espanaensis DSM 44229]
MNAGLSVPRGTIDSGAGGQAWYRRSRRVWTDVRLEPLPGNRVA